MVAWRQPERGNKHRMVARLIYYSKQKMRIKKLTILTLLILYPIISIAQDYILNVGDAKEIEIIPINDIISEVWYSSDPSVVEVVWAYGAKAKIKALKPTEKGQTVTISCFYQYYKNISLGTQASYTERISVQVIGNPTEISIPQNKTLHLGDTWTIIPNIIPNNAYATFTWSSSNTAVATVSSSGVVTPKSFGETAVTVTTDNNLSATCIVTVEKIEATGVSIQHPGSIAVGDTKVLQCSLTPSNANSSVTWSSDNKEIATITTAGYLRAYKKGTVNITATTDNNISATRQIRIYPAPERISLPDEYSLGLRHTIKLAPALYPADAYTTFTWTSDNWDVAEVDEEGVVKALSLGVANITAISKNGLSATCTVNIPYPTPQLYVWMRNGECMTFGFEEKPTLSFTTDNVSISTKSTTIEYPNNEIHKYLIVDAAVKNENSSVTPLVESMDILEIKQEIIKISGSTPRSAVQVYTIFGNMINDYCVDDEGCVMFSTSTYPQGVYIIKTENTTFKFYKR